MAKLQRYYEKDGVYVFPKTGNIIILENVWLEQFYDLTKFELIRLHTATAENENAPRIKNSIIPDLDSLVKIGNL